MMLWLLNLIPVVRGWRSDDGESGQGLAEYSLILGLIAAGCVIAVSMLGDTVVASPAWKIFDGI